ncbi:MAG: hypothetical protein ACREA2_24465 [Blastocatellia bacterium]
MENEATSATTRQYAPQQPANPYDAPYQSQLAQARSAPDNRFDDQTPDTSRLHQAPMAQNYPGYPATSTGVAKKSGALKWVLIAFLCLAMVSCGIGAMVISAIRARQATVEGELDPARPEAEGAPGAPDAPAPPPPPASGTGLEQYKYPNAEVKSSVGVFGNEVVTMITGDSVSEVRDYYKKRLGDPMVEDADDGAVIFQIPGSPMTLITINEDKGAPDKTQITVLRSNLQFPKIN